MIDTIKKRAGAKNNLNTERWGKKERIYKYFGIAVLTCGVILGCCCYSKASTESDYEQIEEKPVLEVISEEWISMEGQYEDCIFSRDDKKVILQIRDSAFGVEGDKKLLLEVTEKDGENNTKTISYGKEDFYQSGTEDNLYECTLDFSAEEEEEKSYEVQLEYIDNSGNKISGDADSLSTYGQLEEGVFHSKTMVVDKKSPEIKEAIKLESAHGLETENGNKYFNEEIGGTIHVKENYLDNNAIAILAIPLNSKAETVVSQSPVTDGKGNINITDWNCQKDGTDNEITFRFMEEGQWEIQFSCGDAAGNRGIDRQTASGNDYINSENFIIDTEAPELKVEFENIKKIADKNSSMENVNQKINDDLTQIMSSDNELFLGKANGVNIEVTEDNFSPENVELELLYMMYVQGGSLVETSRESLREINNWQETEDGKWSYSIKDLPEGHYRIRFRYTDSAGNAMETGEDKETARCIQDNEYLSPICMVDMTKPVIAACMFEQNAVGKNGDRVFFNVSPSIVIKVEEENFNCDNFKMTDVMTYADGSRLNETDSGNGSYGSTAGAGTEWKSYYEKGVRINETRIKIEEQANHLAEFLVEDNAGNASEKIVKLFTYDNEEPEITYTGKDNESGDIIFKMKINSDDKDELMIFRPYRSFRYFGNKKIKVYITAHDRISGVEKIEYSFSGDKDSFEDNTENNKKVKSREESDMKDGSNLSEYSVIVKPEEDDFKGYLQVQAEDFSKNLSKKTVTYGAVAETKDFHETVSGADIELPKAIFTDEKEKLKYYDSGIDVKALFYDSYSGLLNTKLTGTDGKEKIEQTGSADAEKEDIIYKNTLSIKLSSENYRESCKKSPITICGALTDNAGNTSDKIYPEYKIIIDDTKPEINVKYDYYNEESTYYNKARTATVTINDWNFNPDSVKWEIQGSNSKYRIGEWSYTDNVAVCKIYFDKDGEDYAIGLTAADYAGNSSIWKDTGRFTIDMTIPRISIEMDQKDKRNEKFYKSFKKIYFRIEEKNFDKSRVRYEINAVNDKKKLKIPAPTEYITKGDVSYSRLDLKADGQYKISVWCIDLAGNSSKKEEMDEFIIDTTTPKVQILGVEENRTYTDRVMPEVICTDKYLDLSTVRIALLHNNGERTDGETYPYESETQEGKAHVAWSNFSEKKKMDGIYRIHIQGMDLAGNQINEDKEICFRVNRYGADFKITDETVKRISVQYLKEEEDILLSEKSVNYTKSKVIVMKDNEKRTELKKNKQYTVEEHLVTDTSSSYYGWHEKLYRIKKDNFSEEGSYKVLVQSDAYENQSKKFGLVIRTDNEIKGQPIYFIIDKTPPAVSLGNLEDVQYKEKEHPFTVTVLDNFKFEEMELKIKDGKGEINVVKVTQDDLDDNYSFTQKLTEANRFQTISYKAWDKAGNYVDSDKNGDTRKCLVTTKEMVHAFYKKKRSYGNIIVAGVIAVSILGAYVCRRKVMKKREKTDKYETKEDIKDKEL